MAITMISSRRFNQDLGSAKRAARNGPVFITDRGETAHVLMSIHEYQRITGSAKSIVDLLSMPEAAEIDLDVDRPKTSSLLAAEISESD